MGLRICALAILVLFSLYTGWTMLIAEQSLLAFGWHCWRGRTRPRWSSTCT